MNSIRRLYIPVTILYLSIIAISYANTGLITLFCTISPDCRRESAVESGKYFLISHYDNLIITVAAIWLIYLLLRKRALFKKLFLPFLLLLVVEMFTRNVLFSSFSGAIGLWAASFKKPLSGLPFWTANMGSPLAFFAGVIGVAGFKFLPNPLLVLSMMGLSGVLKKFRK